MGDMSSAGQILGAYLYVGMALTVVAWPLQLGEATPLPLRTWLRKILDKDNATAYFLDASHALVCVNIVSR